MNKKNLHHPTPIGAPGPTVIIGALLSLASQLCMEVLYELMTCMNHRDSDCTFHWSILDFSNDQIKMNKHLSLSSRVEEEENTIKKLSQIQRLKRTQRKKKCLAGNNGIQNQICTDDDIKP